MDHSFQCCRAQFIYPFSAMASLSFFTIMKTAVRNTFYMSPVNFCIVTHRNYLRSANVPRCMNVHFYTVKPHCFSKVIILIYIPRSYISKILLIHILPNTPVELMYNVISLCTDLHLPHNSGVW